MSAPTPQEQFKAKLEQIGIPAKEIRCYGSQVMITAWSSAAADKWFKVLHQVATTIRQPKRSIDENLATKDQQGGKKYHEVWLVWATL